jgi:hypothetical protein
MQPAMPPTNHHALFMETGTVLVIMSATLVNQ